MFLLLLASPVKAQTVTTSVAWEQDGDTLTNINQYVYTFKIDSAAPVQLTQACTLVGTQVTCNAPITMTTNAPHSIALTATNGAGSATTTANYVPPTAPLNPKNVKTIIKITVP